MAHMCRECWEPSPESEGDVCFWCRATPAQKARRLRWQLLGVVVSSGAMAFALWLAGPN